MNTITIIIPVRNRKPLTENILTQLNAQIKHTENANVIRIIVVDDGSTDGTHEMIKSLFPEVCLVSGDGNLWWGGAIAYGMNVAVREFNPDWMVWLNDDLEIASNFIEELLKVCSNRENERTIVSGIVFEKTYQNWIVFSGVKKGKPVSSVDEFGNSDVVEVEKICGSIVIVPRKIYDCIGSIDFERLPHHGGDYEYAIRARQYGFQVLLSRNLQAITKFTFDDIVRYIPYWMQWYFHPSFTSRLTIIKNLAQIKPNENVRVFVNLHRDNIHLNKTPSWKYVACFLNRSMKLFGITFLPRNRIHRRIQKYFEDLNMPTAIIEQLWQCRSKNY